MLDEEKGGDGEERLRQAREDAPAGRLAGRRGMSRG